MADTDAATDKTVVSVISAKTQLATLRAALEAIDDLPPLAGWDAGQRGWLQGATPQSVEGPYYLADPPVRRDITEDRQGVPVELRITVLDATTGIPIGDAVVDIWHCDALGWYSGHHDLHPDTFGLPLSNVPPADSARWLRGAQPTDDRGLAAFHTIYPGWYYDRAVHIHMKVHVGGHELFTTQLYFPDEYNAIVGALPPYREHTTLERVADDDDVIYQQTGGPHTMVTVEPVSPGQPELGFTASFTVSVVPEKVEKDTGNIGKGGHGARATTLDPADQLEIYQLLSWYGHVVDWADWDRLSEVFTSDATFEVRVSGSVGVWKGLAEIRAAYASPGHADTDGPGPHHRPGHHASNIVIRQIDGRVRVLSKYFGPTHSGTIFNGEYEDEVVRTSEGWRISSRVVIPRRDLGLYAKENQH